MYLCFLVEEQYRHEGMPTRVIRQLVEWGHQVDVIRPGSSLIPVSETLREAHHDAWVLKTVSGGPGLTLLEAAAAAGVPTINNARSIRGVRDKALAASIGRRHGLPVPVTYAAAHWEPLADIPGAHYPLVVKPANGSSGRGVHLVSSPDELKQLGAELDRYGMLIAQPYVPNSGADLKVYSVAGDLYATERASPLRGPDGGPAGGSAGDRAGGAATVRLPVRERNVPLPADVARIVTEVGRVYGLELFGVDVLLGPDGPVVVDVNDFPSFRQVPDAAARVADAVLRLAARENEKGRAQAPVGAGEEW